MRLPTNPDAVLWQLLELRRTLSSPTSSGALSNIGVFPALQCANTRCRRCGCQRCESRKYTWNRDLKLVCTCCQRFWPPASLPCGAVGLPMARKGGVVADRFAEFGTLVALAHKPRLWERRAWMVYVLDADGYRDTAVLCQRQWPRAPFAWNKDKVHRLVLSARATVARELRRARVLEVAA